MAIIYGFGMLAQLVEQRTFNPLVGGSSPPRPTRITHRIAIKIKGLASVSPFSLVRYLALPHGVKARNLGRTVRANQSDDNQSRYSRRPLIVVGKTQ